MSVYVPARPSSSPGMPCFWDVLFSCRRAARVLGSGYRAGHISGRAPARLLTRQFFRHGRGAPCLARPGQRTRPGVVLALQTAANPQHSFLGAESLGPRRLRAPPAVELRPPRAAVLHWARRPRAAKGAPASHCNRRSGRRAARHGASKNFVISRGAGIQARGSDRGRWKAWRGALNFPSRAGRSARRAGARAAGGLGDAVHVHLEEGNVARRMGPAARVARFQAQRTPWKHGEHKKNIWRNRGGALAGAGRRDSWARFDGLVRQRCPAPPVAHRARVAELKVRSARAKSEIEASFAAAEATA